jgi:hypothetical protein
MQFERLRKNHKKKIIIGGLILVCITSAITITTTRAKYKLTQDIPLVRGAINYKMPDLRIVAINTSEDGTNYNIVDEIPIARYKLNTTRSICKIAATDTKDEEITIEYKEGKVNILGVTKKGTRCYLYFDKQELASEIILNNITVKEGTPDFSKVATTDEGVYKVSDGMYGGYSYYWRGAVTANHVIFANKCWRIVRINGDRTIRLIYNGPVKTGNICAGNGSNSESVVMGVSNTEQYYATNDGKGDNSSYVGWTYILGSQRTTSGTASNTKIQTEKWYNANITGINADKVADGKFCNDRNTGQPMSAWSGYTIAWSATGTQFAYAGIDRLWNKYQPTMSCSKGDEYTLKVGAITADEVEFAGGKDAHNTSYYLYNGQHYWTMSPYYWSGSACVFRVSAEGYITSWPVSAPATGVRPVINLKSDIEFKPGGNGTQSNPYVVE